MNFLYIYNFTEKILPAFRSTGKRKNSLSTHQAQSMLSTTLPLRNSS